MEVPTSCCKIREWCINLISDLKRSSARICFVTNMYTELIFKKSKEMKGCVAGGVNVTNLRNADNTLFLQYQFHYAVLL